MVWACVTKVITHASLAKTAMHTRGKQKEDAKASPERKPSKCRPIQIPKLCYAQQRTEYRGKTCHLLHLLCPSYPSNDYKGQGTQLMYCQSCCLYAYPFLLLLLSFPQSQEVASELFTIFCNNQHYIGQLQNILWVCSDCFELINVILQQAVLTDVMCRHL